MKIIFGCQGQLGDLAINTIVARALKEKYPDCQTVMSINKKYAHAAPIFFNNKVVDGIYIWDQYDGWPNEKDKEFLNTRNFDFLYNPHQSHIDEFWWTKMHHSQAICNNYGIKPPENLQVELTQWFDLKSELSNCIAISPYTSAGAVRDIPIEVSSKIINHIHSLGFKTIQLGISPSPQLVTTYPMNKGTVFEDVVIARSCRGLITADTGINYIMSGYKHPTLGLYSSKCYPTIAPLQNRTPKNPNSIYLQDYDIENISEELIKESINNLFL